MQSIKNTGRGQWARTYENWAKGSGGPGTDWSRMKAGTDQELSNAAEQCRVKAGSTYMNAEAQKRGRA